MKKIFYCVKIKPNYLKLVNEKMKKFISLLLSVAVLASLTVTAFAAEWGDVDADGVIAAADARLALRYSVGLDEPTKDQLERADYDADGEVTAADARLILRVSVGLDANGPDIPEYPMPEIHVPSAKELKFHETLYETCHPLLGQTKPNYPDNFQKWCCYYTIKDVFRPALEKAGYSKAQIDLLAPTKFSSDSIAKGISNLLGTSWPSWLVITTLDLMIPSFLADYYIKTPEAAETFFLYDFYDDIIESKVYEYSDEDRATYVPRVGDVLFISNKSKTYENGYPTVDHTAQIIEVYEDGTFLCTEGSLIESSEGDNRARVRERKYRYNADIGTYEFTRNSIVVVLFAAQPKLS